MLKYLVLVGVIVQLWGIAYYVKDIIGGKVKPNRVTWFMWSIAPLIATIAAISKGVTWAVVPVFMSGFGPFIVFIFTLFNKQSYWKLEIFDYLCGIFSLLALILWGITKEPNVAIVFAIMSDGLAAVPTLVKAWTHPETETGIPYSTGLFNALTGFAAIPVWVFSQFAFPVYLVGINSLLLISVYRKKIKF